MVRESSRIPQCLNADCISVTLVTFYHGIKSVIPMTPKLVQRTQTGVRLETTLLKTLKGLAEYLDMTLDAILRLKAVYGCELTAADSHKLTESGS